MPALTGVEMAGAIGELARTIMPREFRKIAGSKPRIVLLEGGNGILSSFFAELSGAAMALALAARRDGPSVPSSQTSAPIRLRLRIGERLETIAARTVMWAAGVKGSPLVRRPQAGGPPA